jgi:hypothetical protein
MAGARRRSTLTVMLTALALLAMTLRGLLPAGYMVSPARSGELAAITLCTAGGEVIELRDRRTGDIVKPGETPTAPAPGEHGDGHCVFAAMAWVATPAVAPLIQAFAAPQTAAPQAFTARPGQGLAAPPPWSTGPPQTA